MQLNDPTLLKNLAYINGSWQAAQNQQTFAVQNPATRIELIQVANLGAAETEQAIAAANAAWPAWRSKTAKERATVLQAWAKLLHQHAADLATIMTSEQGKPLAEARGEVIYAASFLEWFAEEGKRSYGEVIPTPSHDRRLLTIKQPVGVCAAITPWNFPAAMITRKAGPALAAGCTMLVKPAEQTPLTALALAELGARAGIPAGVFNVLTGDAEHSIAIGQVLTDSAVVRKLSFTGSTEVGRILMRQSANTIKKLSLELGGNAPFIVFADADVDAAVEGAMAAKYRNAGQTCVCANRLIIHTDIYDDFARKLADKVRALRVGDGFGPGVQQGPLIDASALEKIQQHVNDARIKGAKIVVGGQVSAVSDTLGGYFFEPTLITEATRDMLCAREETFGPVAPLFRFTDDAEAIEFANDTEYGLAAYFYSRDIGRIFKTAEALEYGMVGVNTGIISNEVAPFGGIKQSGLGREGSRHGLDEYLEIKYVCLSGL